MHFCGRKRVLHLQTVSRLELVDLIVTVQAKETLILVAKGYRVHRLINQSLSSPDSSMFSLQRLVDCR